LNGLSLIAATKKIEMINDVIVDYEPKYVVYIPMQYLSAETVREMCGGLRRCMYLMLQSHSKMLCIRKNGETRCFKPSQAGYYVIGRENLRELAEFGDDMLSTWIDKGLMVDHPYKGKTTVVCAPTNPRSEETGYRCAFKGPHSGTVDEVVLDAIPAIFARFGEVMTVYPTYSQHPIYVIVAEPKVIDLIKRTADVEIRTSTEGAAAKVEEAEAQLAGVEVVK